MAKLETIVRELQKTATRFNLSITEDFIKIFAEEVIEMDERVFIERMKEWRMSTPYPRLPTFAELRAIQVNPLPAKQLPRPKPITPEEEEIRKQRVKEAIAKCMPRCFGGPGAD
jgi:hypothetical protein